MGDVVEKKLNYLSSENNDSDGVIISSIIERTH